MKTLVNIGSVNVQDGPEELLLEVGADYLGFAIYNRAGNKISRFCFFTFPAAEADESLEEILSQFNKLSFQSVAVCSAFTEALLVPKKFTGADSNFLPLVYGHVGKQQFVDPVPEWQMVTEHAMPDAVYTKLAAIFPTATFQHFYTGWLKLYNGFVADNQLSVHFTPGHFKVLLKKDSAIQLAQTYAYQTPLDVVYYLLKIAEQFRLNQADMHLILSGFIEKNSALYAEVESYFSQIHFANPPEISLPEGDFPQYYFTSLYNLASCVLLAEA